MKKHPKRCPNCKSLETIKKGKSRGKQQYFCKNCKRKFVNSSRKNNKLIKKIIIDYVFNRYLLRDLEDKYSLSKTKIEKLINEYTIKEKEHDPRKIHLVVDAIWFGKRNTKDNFCIIVFRDPKRKENLYWSVEDSETKLAYLKGRKYLESLGYEILSVTGDGFSGIRQAFKGIPYQMCQIHMESIVKKGTTSNPQTEAGKVLLALSKTLHYTDSNTFFRRLKKFKLKYYDFLNEKTYTPGKSKWFYTHRGVRSAWKSLEYFSEYLFVFEKNPKEFNKNTNSIEGHFGHIRDYLNIHRGMKKKLKIKFLFIIFLASSVSPSKSKLDEIL